jgi:hypothetical protein
MNIYHAFRNVFCVVLALLQYYNCNAYCSSLQRKFAALLSNSYVITVITIISNSSQNDIDLRDGITRSSDRLLTGRSGFNARQ